MRLPRYSVRTLLVTTAIIAAVLGAWSFQRLSQQHSAVAAMHRKAQREVAEQRDILAKGVSRRAGESYNPDEAAKLGRNAWEAELFREKVVSRAKFADALRKRVHELTELASYHAKMQDKYERAAAYPWLSVALDPPKPE
jgi:hypothetical protein